MALSRLNPNEPKVWEGKTNPTSFHVLLEYPGINQPPFGILTVELRKWRARESKTLAQNHTAINQV